MIVKFLQYLECEKKYSTHTVTAYKNDLISFKLSCEQVFSLTDLAKVKYVHIRNWIVTLVNQGLTNITINRKLSSLNGYYRYLMRLGVLEVSPLQKHKPLKIQKNIQIPFSKKEVLEVVSNNDRLSDNSFEKLRNKLMFVLLYTTGIRKAELINIKHSNINIRSRSIKVLGKRNKERYIILLPLVQELLEGYIKEKDGLGLLNEYLFVTKKNVKVYEMLVYRVVKAYLSKVSTKEKKSPHMLRHTFATHLLNEGAALNSVKELLGHSSLASTQVYTHNSLEQLKLKFNSAHPRSEKNK